MTVGLDTSVVVRLLIGEPRRQAEAARKLLGERVAAGDPPAAVSDLVVGEAYFALIHHYQVPHADAVSFLRAMLRSNIVAPNGIALDMLSKIGHEPTGAGLMDRLIHADYQADGANLLSFDRATSRLEHAQLIAI